MAFQTQVFRIPGFGVAGDIFDDSPRRVESFMLNSPTPANNVFGRAFSILDSAQNPATVQSGNPSVPGVGPGVYVGVLVNSKSYPLFGTTGSPLAPTLILPNGEVGQFMSMGCCVAYVTPLASNGNIGDVVIYNQTTGALASIVPGTAVPLGYLTANAVVDRFNIGSAGGLGVIRVTIVP